ncbi:MAG: HAD family phosphatase [Acidobacteriota bacterium]|nr:MAG: HAD family phosphatase [Acidobacteriota bacterium]
MTHDSGQRLCFSVSAVAFDLDGVLVDTEAINVRAAYEAFSSSGCALAASDRTSIVGRHPDDYVPLLAARFGLSSDVERQIRARQNETYIRLWSRDARARDGVEKVLPWLCQRGFRLALATSAGRGHARRCLERFEIDRFFEIVLTKDDVARRKPDPEIYLLAVRRLGIDAASLLIVEDSEHGVVAARGAGARCVALATSHTPPEKIAAADFFVDSLAELIELLS